MRLPGLALSPNGENLVYASATAPFQLWLKKRSELRSQPMPGTDRALYPSFSPDGQWVLFVADQRLRKVRTDGGSPITLSDSAAAGFGGAAWLDDGTVVFVGPRLTELSQVSEAGGTRTSVMHDPAFAGFGLGSPAPLPGARGVLFTVCSSGCVTMALHVFNLRTGKTAKLLDDVVQAWYLPMGQLLYLLREGNAMLAPFDLDRLEITGPATPVLQGVYAALGTSWLAWSASGTLAYMEGVGNANELVVGQVDLNGTFEPIDTAWHGGFNSFALSPDGRQLAVGAGLASGTLGIWIKQLDRGPFTRLTFGGQDRRPAWSPDGRTVAFVRDTVSGSSIFARRADGSDDAHLLARSDRAVQEVEWSPDGRWLVARTDNGAAGLGDIIGIHVGGDTAPVPLVASEFTELHPAISPDGHWLAYTSNESGFNEVFVRPFPATGEGRWQVSTGGGEQARWSPDGRELYYLDLSSDELKVAHLTLSPAFGVTERRTLFSIGAFQVDPFHYSFEVRRDGRGFIFMQPVTIGLADGRQVLVLAENWFADLKTRLKR